MKLTVIELANVHGQFKLNTTEEKESLVQRIKHALYMKTCVCLKSVYEDGTEVDIIIPLGILEFNCVSIWAEDCDCDCDDNDRGCEGCDSYDNCENCPLREAENNE